MTNTTQHEDTASETYVWPEGNIKSSERFNDLLKSEQDRLANKIKVGEDRARANSTAVVGAAALTTLLRTFEVSPPLPLLILFLIGVLITLGLTIVITFNRETTEISGEWMLEEQARLWNEDRSYMEVMQLYQRGLIGNIKELQRLSAMKYNWLQWQNYSLIGTVAILVVMLGNAALA